jgi:hypothetical protein
MEMVAFMEWSCDVKVFAIIVDPVESVLAIMAMKA